MSVDVENISINVKTNAGDAAKQFKSLSDAMDGVKQAAGSVGGAAASMSNGVKRAAKEAEPLSAELQSAIEKATKYEVLVNKAATAEIKMNKAFKSGNEDAAWAARERAINAAAAAAREYEKMQPKVEPKATPLPVEQQELIATASQVELLQMKLQSLNDAMQQAFSEGNAGKAVSYRAQIIQTQAAIDRLTQSTEEYGQSAKRATRHSGRLLASIKRIAMYRLLRTALKAVGQAFNEGLKNAYNFSKGIGGTLAEAMDSLATKSLTMKNQLGAAFGNLLTAITPILLQIINLVRMAAQALSALFSALGGGQYLVANDVAQSWDKATGAAKKYKNTILGFDEINRLDDEQGGGGGGGIDASNMFHREDLPGWAQAISDKFNELKDSLDFTNLKESWDKLKKSASELGSTIMSGLGWAWDNILVPLAQWTISSLAPKLIDLLAAAFNFLNAVLQVLAPIFEPFWENVLKPFFEFVGQLVLTGLDELIDLLQDLADLLNGDLSFSDFVAGLDGVQVALLALGGAGVLSAVSQFLGAVATIPIGIKNSISGAAQELTKGPKLVSAIKQVALGAFDAVMVAYDVVKLKEASDTYVAAQNAHNNEINTALSAYAQLYEDKGKEAADQWAAMVYEIDTTNMSFEEAQAAIAQKIETYWEDVPQNMWEGFKQGWDYYFGENGVGLWQLFKDAFEGVLTWLRDFLGIHSPSTVFEDIGTNIVQGLIDGFDAQWDIFLTGAQALWDGFKTWVAGWSLPSPTLPHIKLTYDEYDPSTGLGKALKKFLNITQVPKFNVEWYAEGGVHDLSMGSLFVAGEAGAEIVSNLGNGKTGVTNVEQMEAAVANGNANVVNAVYAMANMIVQAVNEIDPDITLDGQSLAQQMYPYTTDYANRRGSGLVTIGGTV